MKNSNRKIATISWLMCALFLAGVFVPGLLGMDGFDGGFALSAFFIFVAIMFGSAGFVYGKLAQAQDRIFADSNLLASWQIPGSEWQDYAVKEYKRDKQEKRMLFLMVAGWSVFFGILFPILDHENGYWVSIIMAGLIVLIGFVALLSVSSVHRSNLKSGGKVFISAYGAFFGGRMYAWGMVGGMLQEALLREEYLEVTFLGGKTSYTIRIPVPADQKEKALDVTRKLEDIAVAAKPGILQRF